MVGIGTSALSTGSDENLWNATSVRKDVPVRPRVFDLQNALSILSEETGQKMTKTQLKRQETATKAHKKTLVSAGHDTVFS